MNKELCIAILISAVVHGAMLGGWPAQRSTSQGEKGDNQEIVVLGVLEFKHAGTVEPNTIHQSKPDFADALRDTALTAETEESPPQVPMEGEDGRPGENQVCQGHLQNIRCRYLGEVARRLEEAKEYPLSAYRRGIQGTARVEFTILSSGVVSDAIVDKSSNHRILDQAAKNIVQKAAPFDPIPADLAVDRMTVVAPISFRINSESKGTQRKKEI